MLSDKVNSDLMELASKIKLNSARGLSRDLPCVSSRGGGKIRN